MSEITLTNELTAWGETKTIAEWARDERATASAKIIANRTIAGSPPEKAITGSHKITNAVVHSPGKHEKYAFGKWQTLAAWCRDPRCTVELPALRSRVATGWELERAITTPPHNIELSKQSPKRLVEAWGESKSLAHWLLDARCVTSLPTINQRIQDGWSPERAMSEPRIKTGLGRMIVAFGESKSPDHWARDPRCIVSRNGLLHRIAAGMDAETAMTTPRHGRGANAQKPSVKAKVFEYDGRTLSLAEWADQPECHVSISVLIGRVFQGWTFSRALLQPANVRGTKRRRKKGAWAHLEYMAFGEKKPFFEWVLDPRCVVNKMTLADRIKKGCSMETALLTQPFEFRTKNPTPRYEAFGSLKTLVEWSRDPRCRVEVATLRTRVAEGWKMEDAITVTLEEVRAARNPKNQLVTAFGESKTVGDWAQDPRCNVPPSILLNRIACKVDAEIAITAGPHEVRRSDGSVTPRGQLREAFSESKTLGAWFSDSRCVASKVLIKGRLKQGWPLERALSMPPGSKKDASQESLARPEEQVLAFGEIKSLREWSVDPRARVNLGQIRRRLRMGIDAEVAITGKKGARLAHLLALREGERGTDGNCLELPEPMLRKYKEGKNNKLLTAFGETKTMSEWALDPRGTVCAGAMCGRLRRGFSPEMAISSAKHGLRKKGNPKVISESELERRRQVAESSYRKYKKDKKVLAFGERKNLASWARDPRATVCSAAIRARLLKGITPELAISGEGWQRTARKKKAA